jgi:predicted MFS family arabinose efflux permease
VSESRTSEALRIGVFRRFLICISIANTGQFLQGLAMPFLINDLTDSNTWVGGASFASLLPAVLVTPLAGILADRIDRRKILLLAYSVQTLLTLLIVVLYETGQLTPWRIIIISFVSGGTAGFQWAPIQSMSPSLVPEDLLISAVRLVSISFTAGRALGPALAALTLAFWGPGPAFIGTFVAYVIAVVVLFGVRTGWQPGGAGEPYWKQFVDGLRYVRARPGMRLCVGLVASGAFFLAVFTFALAASVADDAYGAGGGGLGLLAMTIGIGSVVGSVIISFGGGAVKRSTMEFVVLVTYCGALLLAAATPWLLVGLVGFFLLGITHMLHGVTMSTALQVQVEEEYRGRVMSVWLMAMLGSLPIGAITGGILADAIDIRAVMAMYSSIMLVGVLIRASMGRGFRALDNELETALNA